MSRLIDKTAPVEFPRPVKVVVVSLSRTGTLGLYNALKILGFKTYHMFEIVTHKLPDTVFLHEAIEANRNSNVKSFTRKDYDKWFGEYEAIVEVPSFFIDDFLAAYSDPNIKFILTERDPDAWVKSWRNTIADEVAKGNALHMRVLRHFDTFTGNFFSAITKLTDQWTGGKGLTEEGFTHSRQFYVDYVADIKRRIPADQLLCLKLEAGELGWDSICPYLGVDIPDQPWPSLNEKEFFKDQNAKMHAPNKAKAQTRLAMALATVAAVVGVASWYYRSQLR